jgi:hypothetical protein
MAPFLFFCHNYEPEDVYNMNETVLYFRGHPNKTLVQGKVKGRKLQKERVTLALAVNSTRTIDEIMSINTYIEMEGEEIIELELSIDELVDVALGINYAQGFDLNVDLHSVDVDDVAPPTIKFSDAKRHASLLPNFLLDNSLHFGVNEFISFQKLVGNLDKMTIATWVGNTKDL